MKIFLSLYLFFRLNNYQIKIFFYCTFQRINIPGETETQFFYKISMNFQYICLFFSTFFTQNFHKNICTIKKSLLVLHQQTATQKHFSPYINTL